MSHYYTPIIFAKYFKMMISNAGKNVEQQETAGKRVNSKTTF